MINNSSMVTAIIIFLNEEKFIVEAIESVQAQTYENWELLLVDDGSTDASTHIARQYAAQNPEKISYLEHKDHQNRGMSASRNLGISHAQGEYVAFLDADDIWLPDKLTNQVAILSSQPSTAMVYGRTKYWYSWTGNAEEKIHDYIQPHGIDANVLYQPPALLSYYLRGKAAVPCTCSLLVRREALERIGGFEDSFTGMYEDQAFYAKISIKEPIFVSDEYLDQYRQHPDSVCSVAVNTGRSDSARKSFLNWLKMYLAKEKINDVEVLQAIRKELWFYGHETNPHSSGYKGHLVRRTKKWLLKLEELILPAFIRRRLWS